MPSGRSSGRGLRRRGHPSARSRTPTRSPRRREGLGALRPLIPRVAHERANRKRLCLARIIGPQDSGENLLVVLRWVEPQPVLLRRYDHRHAIADGLHEGVGVGRDDGARLDHRLPFAPPLPQRRGLITVNPFSEVRGGSQENASRNFFVTREVANAVLAACPDNEWRLIISLSRGCGLRCPSETLELKWSDIDWEQGRIVIRESKTRARTIPLFAELRPHLEQAFEEAPAGASYVIRRYRGGNCNLRTQFLRILARAGLTAWPRLFHNLRASRETELVRDFPIHVVCKWIGNSMKVAQKHYLQITDADYEKATSNPTSHRREDGGTPRHAETKTAVPLAFASDTAVQVPPAGIEPAT